jgi:integrase
MAFIQKRPRKDGSTSFQLNFRWPPGSPQQAVTFEAEDSAQHWLGVFEAVGIPTGLKLLEEALDPTLSEQRPPPAPTVQEIVEDYIDHHTGLSSGTRGRSRKEAARDIYPTLGALPITTVTAQTGETWINYLLGPNRQLRGKPAEPLSGKTIENRHGLLSSSFNRAVSKGLLPGNPLRGLQIPESLAVDMTFLDTEEWWLIHDCLSTYWQPLVSVLVGSGLRFGEATALRATDIDLAARQIRVTKAWKEDENGRRYIGPPKSKAGKRSVEYGDTLEPILEKLVKERPGDQLLLVNRADNPILNNSFHSRGWGLAVKKAQGLGLSKSPRPHDLRHTFASWALASGEVNIFMLAVIMGHDNPTVTQNRYGHLMPSSRTAVAQAVGNRMARAASLPQRPAVATATN